VKTDAFSISCCTCGRKISFSVSEAEKKHIEAAGGIECPFCNEHIWSKKEGRIFRKVSPEKLSYVVQELRKKEIEKPTVKDVVIVFETRGWKISQSQAWNYKKMAEAEMQ
jgi:DNA-directed RNA polymerase subunit RPC12/RpoP